MRTTQCRKWTKHKDLIATLALGTLTSATIAATAPASHADQTIGGAIGLPLNPTAQIPDEDSVRVQGNYYNLGKGPTADLEKYGIFAATRVGDNLEISGGVGRLDARSGANQRTGIAMGAKYLFNRSGESPTGTRIAIGAGHDRALLMNTHVYAVASRAFGAATGDRPPIMGHLGVRYDRFENNVVNADSSKISVYGGVEVPISATGDWTLVGELQSENTDSRIGSPRFPYSASVRYRPQGSGFSASVGIARQGLVNDSGLFVQVGKTF